MERRYTEALLLRWVQPIPTNSDSNAVDFLVALNARRTAPILRGLAESLEEGNPYRLRLEKAADELEPTHM